MVEGHDNLVNPLAASGGQGGCDARGANSRAEQGV